jgi:hypothetical protein
MGHEVLVPGRHHRGVDHRGTRRLLGTACIPAADHGDHILVGGGPPTGPAPGPTSSIQLDERKILVEADFVVERADNERRSLLSSDEREVPFDLLVITVPVNVGAEYVGRSVLSDELNQRQGLHRQDQQRPAAIHLTGRTPYIKESR